MRISLVSYKCSYGLIVCDIQAHVLILHADALKGMTVARNRKEGLVDATQSSLGMVKVRSQLISQ